MFERVIDNSWNFNTANTKEYTHCYHTYPAMMIPQVARKLIQEYAPEGRLELLFDPYAGSGTTLVEASIKNINSIGTDINPLARMLSKAKTTHFDIEKIDKALSGFSLLQFSYSEDKVVNRDFSRISNYKYWYSEEVLLKLSYIYQKIEELEKSIQMFFTIPFSELVREVSFTRNGEFKRFRMPIDKIKNYNPDVFQIYNEKLIRNYKGLKEYNSINNNSKSNIYDFNTVYDIPQNVLPESSVDMVVTSPPYGDSNTTVAYGQFSRWANEWFDFPDSKNLDKLLMGGKSQKTMNFSSSSISKELDEICQKDVSRYNQVISFLNDYSQSIKNISKIVRKGGVICFVVGNRTVKGVQIPLDYFTAEIFENNGFKHDTTIVREIPSKRMPSKNSPTNETGVKSATMTNEYIVIMHKA